MTVHKSPSINSWLISSIYLYSAYVLRVIHNDANIAHRLFRQNIDQARRGRLGRYGTVVHRIWCFKLRNDAVPSLEVLSGSRTIRAFLDVHRPSNHSRRFPVRQSHPSMLSERFLPPTPLHLVTSNCGCYFLRTYNFFVYFPVEIAQITLFYYLLVAVVAKTITPIIRTLNSDYQLLMCTTE